MIFNGRAGRDKFICNATTVDGSVIDYVIGTPSLLAMVEMFSVSGFDPLFSDKHCVMHFSVALGCTEYAEVPGHIPSTSHKQNAFGRWDADKTQEFAVNLNPIMTNTIMQNADSLSIDKLNAKI